MQSIPRKFPLILDQPERIMQEISAAAIYFSQPGKLNTQRTLQLVAQRADQLNIKTILVATTSGETAVQAAKMLPDKRLIAVSHAAGWQRKHPGIDPGKPRRLEAAGVTILPAAALGGVTAPCANSLAALKAMRSLPTPCASSSKAEGHRRIAIMAADAGLVDGKKPGHHCGWYRSGRRPGRSSSSSETYNFFDIRVWETICRPAPEHPQFQ